MREIRYRGIGIAERKWVFGSLWFDTRNKATLIWSEELEYWVRVDPATVGQYTGLKDKNGKEIYEGDVMEIPETEFNAEIIGRVLFEEDAYYIIPLRGGHLWGLHWSLRKHDAKIIGNIHDNPELLKNE